MDKSKSDARESWDGKEDKKTVCALSNCLQEDPKFGTESRLVYVLALLRVLH